MTCKDIKERLAAYQEGIFSSEDKSLIEAHLDTCAQCSSALADLKKTIDALKDLPEVEPPPWFTQKIMAQVREETEQKHGLLKKLFYPFHIKIPIEAFATVLVVIIGAYVYQSVAPETKTVSQPSQAEIQRAIPFATPPHGPARTTKDTGETKEQSDFAATPSREKASVPIPTAEKDAAAEQKQKPAAAVTATPSWTDMAREKKQEGMYGSPRPRQEPALPPTPLAGEKEGTGAAGAAQKDLRELKELGITPQSSKSARAEKQTAMTLSVLVTDVQAAIYKIETILARVGAQNVTRDSRDGNEIFNARLQTEKTSEFLQELSTVGIVQEKAISKIPDEGNVVFRIEITMGNSS